MPITPAMFVSDVIVQVVCYNDKYKSYILDSELFKPGSTMIRGCDSVFMSDVLSNKNSCSKYEFYSALYIELDDLACDYMSRNIKYSSGVYDSRLIKSKTKDTVRVAVSAYVAVGYVTTDGVNEFNQNYPYLGVPTFRVGQTSFYIKSTELSLY